MPTKYEVEEVAVFKIEGNSDTTEGRGHTVYNYALTKVDAERYAAETAVMGYWKPDQISTTKALKFPDGSIHIIGHEVKSIRNRARDRALAKLTKEEKEALGLKE